MSSAEPLGVAFVEIEPIAPLFRAKAEAQVRAGLAGVGSTSVGPTNAVTAATARLEGVAAEAAAAQRSLASGNVLVAESANAAAGAEERAALATKAHASAAVHATEAIEAEALSLAGLRGHSLGLNPAFLAATAASILFFKSAEQSDEFVERMHEVEFATHATEEQMDSARDTARKLGRDLSIPATSSLDAAQALSTLTNAGQSLEQAEQQARDVLLLHTAANIDLQKSTDIVVRLQRAYRLEAEQSAQVTDTLTAATKSGAGSTEEYASALETLAPIAHSLGLDIQDTATLLIQFGQGGVSASQAATLTRLAFARLAAGSKPVRDGLHEIGLELDDLRDSQGNLRPDVFVILGEAVQHLGQAQRQQALSAIFGARAGARLLPLLDQTRDEYQRAGEAARESGLTQEEAAIRTRNAAGAFREMKQEASDLVTTLGGLLVPTFVSVAHGATDIFHGINIAVGGIDHLVNGSHDASTEIGSLATELHKAVEDLDNYKSGAFADATITAGLAARVEELRKQLEALGVEFDSNGNVVLDWAGLIDRAKDSVEALLAAAKGAAGAQNETNAVGDTLATQLAIAEAQGDTDAQLRILRQQRANAIKRQQSARTNPHLTPAQQQAKIQQAANDQKTAQDKIEAILTTQENDAKAAAASAKTHADNIEKAASDRDAAFIRAQQSQLQDRQGAVSAAQSTDTLRDDIRADVKLRNFLTAAIQSTRERIRQARAAGRATEALVAELATLRREKNQVRREIEALQRENAQQAAETRVESAQLDLQIIEARVGSDPSAAQTNALVRAHLRVIAALKRAQKLAKGRTLEVKRLQVEIEQEKAAIRELRKAQNEDTGGGSTANFGALSFQFLQQQQGILSNFGPNFFPAGALSVGGGNAATAPPRRTAAQIKSPFEGPDRTRSTAGIGITHGQASELVHQMRVLVQEMKLLRKGAGHPSNRHSEVYNRHLDDHH